MRVLLIPTPPDAGGATRSGVHRYMYELARAMQDMVEYVYVDGGRDIEGLRLIDTAGEKPEASAGARRERSLPLFAIRLMMGYARETLKMARAIRSFRGKVDLVHVVAAGCEPQNIAARIAGLKPIVSTVQVLHGPEAAAGHWVRRLVERLSFACADMNIMVSDATGRDWHERIGLAPEKCVTIFNAMEPPDLSGYDRNGYRRQFCGDRENAILVGTCARLHWMKGHTVLLDAFARLLKDPAGQGRELKLLFAGEGPERAEIESKIRDLGIGQHVRLLGHRTDPVQFVAALDLHVLPSVAIETIGYANIEAMFAGTPCIVSDTGGMKEIVGASGGGRVAPAGDPRALCEAIGYYVENPDRRKRAGENARRYAHEHLTARVMAEKTMAVYELAGTKR